MAPGHECYRLIKHWEKGPVEVNGVPWPRSAEGAALKAYQCSAGKWTISFGVRWHPDGRPVVEGDTITEADVMPYLEAAMGRVASDVRRAFDIQLTQNQFDAITVWVYNLSIGRMNTSTELKDFINQGRTSDAAAEMCTYVYATTQASDGYPWKRAMRGLLIRRLTESCVWMGYDWEEACEPDGVALPTKRRFEPEWVDPNTGKKGRYYDDIQVGKTKLSDTLYKAQRYPLTLVLDQPAPPPTATGSTAVVGGVPTVPPVQVGTSPTLSPAPTVPPVAARKPEPVPASPAPPARAPVPAPPVGGVIVRKGDAPVPDKPIIIAPERINPNALPTNADTVKNMADSTRMVGMVLVAIGSIIQVVTLRLGIGTAIGAVFFDLTRDPVVITLAVTAIVAALGWITKRNGKKTFAKGADQAQGNLY
jgi:lysozyme